jgi:diguanylate cyclase (GGDEF)-like protein
MTVPLNPLKRPLSDAFASVIQIVAIISVLLLLISFLVNRHFIIRPLTQFTSHVLQVQRAESLASRPRLGDKHLGLLELQVLAQHFDAALDKLACAQERLREQSEIDELTGLLNRRAFNRCIALELSRAKRYARPVAIFVLDLDGFKAINDKHGHAAGDAVLRQCATLLRQSLRQNDLIARIGGDELVIVVPEMEQGAATVFRHKLRRLVTDAETQHEGLRLQVGASIGVALFPWDGDTPQRLLSRADAMMYEEKRQKQLDC